MWAPPLDGHACALLCLATDAAWSPDLPAPLSRSVVRRMLDCGAVEGLTLREVPGVSAPWLAQARALLTRARHVCDCLHAYEAQGYRLLMPGRAQWPKELHRLGGSMPLFLFARGNLALLEGQRIAVAGSRSILKATRQAAEALGHTIAQAGMTLVSGGAQGVDSAAQQGALEAGGGIILVPALPVSELLQAPGMRAALEAGRLLLLCDALPDTPFSAGKALSRNHTIYALGHASLVVASRDGRGGSWRGAVDCLRGGFSRVFVWEGCNADTQGNRALEKLGARTFSLQSGVPLSRQLFDARQMKLFDDSEEG